MKTRLKPGTFIIMRGLPGSGKSTLVKALHKHFCFASLEPDSINRESKGYRDFCGHIRVKNLSEKKRLYRFMLYKVINLLEKGKAVLWAQPWSKVDGILLTTENLGVLYKGGFPLRFVLVEICIDREIARTRVGLRYRRSERGLTVKEFDNKFSSLSYEVFSLSNTAWVRLGECEERKIVLDGSNPVPTNLKVLRRGLSQVAENAEL